MESEVWLMPPIYHRVWYWLRMNVQHEPFLFPTREKFGIWVLPGQRITSLQLIAEGVKWVEWGREVIPNKKTIKDVLDWLIHREMVTAESNAKGTFITLVNWSSYNRTPDQKVTAESNSQGTRSGHKVEGIELKPKKPSSVKLPADSRYFTDWWCYSFHLLGGNAYIFEGAKDGKQVSFLLGRLSLEELLLRACDFLTSSDPFLIGKRTISMFRSFINKTSPNGDINEYRREGIYPPDGINFKEWQPWKEDSRLSA